MALDFQKLREEIKKLGQNAPERQKERLEIRQLAKILLGKHASDLEELRDKVQRAAKLYPNLRSAVPTVEPLNAVYSLPDPPTKATIIAADGSQINPNRHDALEYSLVNVGAIIMKFGEVEAPEEVISTELFYDDQMYSMTEGMVALIRDQREREVLANLAGDYDQPVVTFTDGGIELWNREPGLLETTRFEKYLAALKKLHKQDAITAGYVDKPGSSFVVQLIKIAEAKESQLGEIKNNTYLRQVIDKELFSDLLGPGQRSAIFSLQSPTASKYEEELSIHFFYVNTSMDADIKSIARIEAPKWVVASAAMLNLLHAVIVDQSQIVSNSFYPYLLARADEIARVSRQEKEQVDTMIAVELRQRGVPPGRMSAKQQAKEYTARK